jgi:hypothetical protein
MSAFLFEHEMLEPGKSGKIPVVRGDADASEMIRRILSDDPDETVCRKTARRSMKGNQYPERLDQ